MTEWRPPTSLQIGRAIRSLSTTSQGVVGYWPVAKMNPFQAAIYSEFPSHGLSALPVLEADGIAQLSVAPRLGARAALHLHWTHGVTATAETEATAREQARAFVGNLEELASDDISLVWTIHNALPHRLKYLDVEVELRESLVEMADLIHVMSTGTIDAVADMYPLDDTKCVSIPHPAYADLYPKLVYGRERARSILDLPPKATVVASIGSIGAYKRLDLLASSLNEMRAADHDVFGLIAGIPADDFDQVPGLATIEASPHMRLIARQLTDKELVQMHEAADLAVYPYRASLNSGAAVLSLSLGVPVVAPRLPAFSDIVTDDVGVLYDPESSLTDAIVAAVKRQQEGAFVESSFSVVNETRSPQLVSSALAGAIAGVMDMPERIGG